MITGYEIINKNNEEILYVYIDIDNEFSFNYFKDKKDKLEQNIKKFIKDNKILFTGVTVTIVVSGMIVGNIALSNNPSYTNISPTVENILVLNNNMHNDTSINNSKLIDNNNDNTNIENNIKTEIKNYIDNTTSQPDNINVIQINDRQNNQDSYTFSMQEDNKEKGPIQEDNNQIYVTIKRYNGDIITLELEDYVFGVVGAEMPAAFNDNALMAQAIIARTYALKANSRSQVLTDNVSTQSYKDNEELKVLWDNNYNNYYNKVKSAVENTKGMYLTYDGNYIEAVYHSTSNGKTEDAFNVWGYNFPYLVSVPSPYDNYNPSFEIDKNITYTELSQKLGTEITKDTNFNILNRTIGDRVDYIEVNGKIYKGTIFRNLLELRSADFDIIKNNDYVTFKTRGYGHGVGMSQYGANGMARNGYNYNQILSHYYPGTIINQL